MLVLDEKEKCPHSFICPHNNNCLGANSKRKTKFTCDLIENGKIQEDSFRSPLDETGKMKVIME